MDLAKVLIWDKNSPKDVWTYKKGSKSNDLSLITCKDSRGNIDGILNHFDSISMISSLKGLTNELFQSGCANQLYVIFIFAYSMDSKSLSNDHDTNDIIQFISSQLMHRSHYLVVLSDDTSQWSEFGRLGAHDVGNGLISEVDLERYMKRVNQVEMARRSRCGQLKLSLGLSDKILPCGVLRAFSSTYQIALTPDMPVPFNNEKIMKMTKAIGSWDFRAHDFEPDDLAIAAFVMLRHAFSAQDIDIRLKLSDSRLITFILVLRNCYHPSNPYHNFIHAIDVMQATFYILVQIGYLPAIGDKIASCRDNKILDSTKSTCLLIAALGHDAGHPGVTNNILVSCNAPLARVYNDTSVLESYHSAVTSQVISSYFPLIANDSAKKSLIVDSILATDMAKHFQYMKWFEEPDGLWKQNPANLIGCMIIKCADISNVTRSRKISFYWGQLLAEEFIDITGLASALGLDDGIGKNNNKETKNGQDSEQKLAKNQLFFVKTYCLPLFEQLVKQFPELGLLLDNLHGNIEYWQKVIEE